MGMKIFEVSTDLVPVDLVKDGGRGWEYSILAMLRSSLEHMGFKWDEGHLSSLFVP